MIEALGKTDLGQQLFRPRLVLGRTTVGCRCDERRRQNVLQHRALRQQRMILKDEADSTIAKGRLIALAERKRILPLERD
jgi:hypothetical protein